jgi:hypothetical protein
MSDIVTERSGSILRVLHREAVAGFHKNQASDKGRIVALTVEDGKVQAYRTRRLLFFKYES